VGLAADPMLLGGDVEKMSDTELAEAAEKIALFARLTPAHKQRVIRVLRGNGHVVGFMGDGINDASASLVQRAGIFDADAQSFTSFAPTKFPSYRVGRVGTCLAHLPPLCLAM
jgi:hypothetical protein